RQPRSRARRRCRPAPGRGSGRTRRRHCRFVGSRQAVTPDPGMAVGPASVALLLAGTLKALADHTRNAARLVPRPRDPVLEIAARARTDVARPHIGPGAAFVVGFAGGLARPS